MQEGIFIGLRRPSPDDGMKAAFFNESATEPMAGELIPRLKRESFLEPRDIWG